LFRKPKNVNISNFGNRKFLFLKTQKKEKINVKIKNFNKIPNFKHNQTRFNLFFNFFNNVFFIFNFVQATVFNFFNFTSKNLNVKTFFNFNFLKRLKNIRKKIKKLKLTQVQSVVVEKYKNTKHINKFKKTNLNTLKILDTFAFLKKKKCINFFANNVSIYHARLKKLNNKMFFFFKKAKTFMKRYYKRFFDFYPNESYSFVDKNSGKFQLPLNQRTKHSNNILGKNKLELSQTENFLFQKNQLFDDVFFSFFSFCYTFFDLWKIDKINLSNFVLLQKNVMLLDLLKKKRYNRVLRARLQHSQFKLQQQASVPGKIVFTLNSNSIFLTVSDSSGVTLLQSSTGSVSKTLKSSKLRKEIKPGCGFKRRKIARQIKVRRMIKDFSKGKTKKLKKKFIAQMSRRQKGKRRFKTKSKTKFISQDFVKPLFFLLETFLFRVRNFQSRKQLLKTEKLKIKLKTKLFKLKKTNKVKTKTYKDIKKKINEMQKFVKVKASRKTLTLDQKNAIKFLFPLKKKILKETLNRNSIVKLIEKLRFNKRLKRNRFLSLALKKKISNFAPFKNINFNSVLNFKTKTTNLETYFSNLYLKNLKKKYSLLKQNKQKFFNLVFFNKKLEKKKLSLFFTKIKNLKYSQTFFSSYILCLKNFSIATIRRIFIYALKVFLRKTRTLKKEMAKKTNLYVNRLYLKNLKLNNAN